MGDKNTKELEPSTSKNSKKHSSHDLIENKGHDDRRSDSDSWSWRSYSVKSEMSIADGTPEDSKAPVRKRDTKPQEREKRGRRRGRVEKRRQEVRKALKRRPRLPHKRHLSVSTIFTRLSQISLHKSKGHGCRYCGHRCCFRR